MKDLDVLLSPTVAIDIPRIDEVKDIDQISEFANDYFTVPSSIAGTPALCIPGKTFGTSLKVWGKFGNDRKLIDQSAFLDNLMRTNENY